MNLTFIRKNFLTIIIILALAVILGVGVNRFTQGIGPTPIAPAPEESKVKVVSEESVVIEVVKKASPSVASIVIERKLLSPFEPFSGPPTRQSGIGTGFVLRPDGILLTNRHVVDTAGRYFAILKDESGEKKFEIKKIHKDPFNDLAILQIDPTAASGQVLKPLELGDSSKLQVGQKVVAIGNALGRLANTVTTGVISGLGRGISPIDPTTGIAEQLDDVIQTDAAINPGNSGGPLLNTAGQVIGVNTAVAGAENIGFALPVNVAKALLDDFEKTGKISRPFLGIRYTHISRDVALLNEVPEGEFVREVVSSSVASDADIQVGDIIIAFDDQKLTEDYGLRDLIRDKKVGEKVKITIWRDGATIDKTVVLGEAPSE